MILSFIVVGVLILMVVAGFVAEHREQARFYKSFTTRGSTLHRSTIHPAPKIAMNRRKIIAESTSVEYLTEYKNSIYKTRSVLGESDYAEDIIEEIENRLVELEEEKLKAIVTAQDDTCPECGKLFAVTDDYLCPSCREKVG